MRRILLLAVLLIPAGCSSLDTIPLSDAPISGFTVTEAPIPEAAPRAAASVPAEPEVPMPPSRSAALAAIAPGSPAPAVEPAAVPEATTIEPAPPAPAEAPVGPQTGADDGAAGTAMAAHVTLPPAGPEVAAAEPRGQARSRPMPSFVAMAFADEREGTALTAEGAIYRSGLIERRNVLEPCAADGSGCASAGAEEPSPVTRRAIVDATASAAPAAVEPASLSRIEIPAFNARTIIWIMIGFAALIGLVLSARQPAD